MPWRSMMSSTSPRASKARSNSAFARSGPNALTRPLAPLRRPGIIWPPLRPEAPQPILPPSEQHHFQAALGGMKRRRQPGAAAADDHEVGFDIANKRRMVRRRISGGDIVGFVDVESGIEAC